MKKYITFLFIGILLSTSIFSQNKIIKECFDKHLPQDSNNWKKTKEESKEDSSFQIEFTSEEDPEDRIIFAFEEGEVSVKSIGTDLFSLLSKEDVSALEKMKQLRLDLKKVDSPYSIWKLLYVFDENDIIYEYNLPSIGVYPHRYEMTRLIKKQNGYLKIIYQSSKQPSKESRNYWLKWLIGLTFF